VGFHPVAVALQNDTQIEHNYKQTTDNIHINTQNIHIKYKNHTKYNTKKRKGSKKLYVIMKNCVLRMPRRAAPARTNAPEESVKERRMQSSRMLHRVALVRTDVSK
jgi:hypothetical protein